MALALLAVRFRCGRCGPGVPLDISPYCTGSWTLVSRNPGRVRGHRPGGPRNGSFSYCTAPLAMLVYRSFHCLHWTYQCVHMRAWRWPTDQPAAARCDEVSSCLALLCGDTIALLHSSARLCSNLFLPLYRR